MYVFIGELLTGVMDKAAIGNSSLGLVHAVYELYGSDQAGRLLSALGRMLTYYLQDAGHTCGIEDLLLTKSADKDRFDLLNSLNNSVQNDITTFLNNESINNEETSNDTNTIKLNNKMTLIEIENSIKQLLSNNKLNNKIKLDNYMQSIINKLASVVIKKCLPNGLNQLFLKNNFTIMVSTGAKGSQVNQSQITCFLGQQALEGWLSFLYI